MVQIAIKTLAAFERAVSADQGNTWRQWLGRVLPHIGDAYRSDEAAFRTHMGASGIGAECPRAIWYSFRWYTKPVFSGRMLRLFNRGHMEEARFIALLLSIGCAVYQQDANGKQFRISELGGHYGGACDGVVTEIPDLPPNTPALNEYKTHNEKSFKKLAGDNWSDYVRAQINPSLPKVKFTGEGLKLAKPQHYVQMQQYMGHMGLSVGLYFAVNKNDDEIYAEVVYADPECVSRYTQRAISLVLAQEPPKRMSDTPSWFQCKFCDHSPVCHYGHPAERNCRTCHWSRPREDGTWWCKNKDRQREMLFGPKEGVAEVGETFELSKARQLKGCVHWVKNASA